MKAKGLWRFLAALSAIIAFAASAQTTSPLRVAWVSLDRGSANSPLLAAFRSGMAELGYLEGKNLVIQPWWGEGSPERLTQMIEPMLLARPDFPGDTLEDVIEMASESPGAVSYGHTGVGTGNHLLAKMIETSEVPVVGKGVKVREEVVVRRERTSRVESVRGSVRRDEIEILRSDENDRSGRNRPALAYRRK
jgi:hypothetical protein